MGLEEINSHPVWYHLTVYPKICLCGSTKFKEDFFEWAKFFTLQGCIVTMPMVFMHSGDSINEEQKVKLDELHKAKIKDADGIFVINKNGYIGESTRSEIQFAKQLNKKILYLEELKS